MIKLRTLFSGIGSPEIALRELGIDYEVMDFCEIDKYAAKSYSAVHGVDESKNLGDVTKVWGRNLPYADLMVWGFPCQDISVAGKQRGIQEGATRSGLYYEGFRILKETMPKYSIIENVKNLVGKKFKENFNSMLEDIESIGYNNYWKVLNAKDYGIPQNRERVFIISIRKDVDNGKFTFPEGFDNGLRLKDLLEDEVDEKYYISQEKTEKPISQIKDKEISNSIRCGGHGSIDRHQWDMACVQLGSFDKEDINDNERQRRVYSDEGVSPTILARTGNEKILTVERTPLKFLDRNGKKTDGNYAFCVDTAQTGGIKEHLDNGSHRIRKLTPKECWRLMGFKDTDFEKAAQVNSNSQLYKQAGNSIVSDVLYHIFDSLLNVAMNKEVRK